jgi:L-asparaginase II
MSNYETAIIATRAGIIESVHQAAIAVVDRDGNLVAHWGGPDTITFVRSSAKPFQALPLIESGARDHFHINDPELALICGSHAGTEDHVDTLQGLLSKIGVSEGDLLCGVQPPKDRPSLDRLRAAGIEPTAAHHNCSGKHAGMLALSVYLGQPIASYLDLDGEVQRRIIQTIAEMANLDVQEIDIGIDGCSAPNFAMPLASAAQMYARLIDPSGLPAGRVKACNQVNTAMTSYPAMVSNTGRFDTELMLAMQDQVLAKGGAEGFLGIAIRLGTIRDGSPALGMALKIADGSRIHRARSILAMSTLSQLGVLSSDLQSTLSEFGAYSIHNDRGIEVGAVEADFEVELLRPI